MKALLLPGFLKHTRKQFPILILSAVVFSLSFYLFYHQVYKGYPSDLPDHIKYTAGYFNGRVDMPHPFFHYAVYYFSFLSGWGLNFSAIFLLSSAVVLNALIQFNILRSYLEGAHSQTALVFWTLVLMTVSAIYMPFFNKNIYLGQFSPNIWHNPTTVMVKPMAFLCMIAFLKAVEKSPDGLNRFYFLSAAALLISALIKPSFAIAFIPGVVLYSALFYFKRQSMWIGDLLVFIPTLFVLMYQYSILNAGSSGKIVIDFLGVWRHYSPNPYISLCLLIAFPLGVIVCCRKCLSNKLLGFSWIIFLIALAQFSLFAEWGRLYVHGNFSWGLMIAAPMLFLSSLMEYLKGMTKETGCFRGWGCRALPGVLLCAHFISGAIYLIQLLMGKSFL